MSITATSAPEQTRHPLPDWLRARAQATPDRLALLTEMESLTYAALDRRVTDLVGRLAAHNILPQMRVAVLMEAGLDYALLIHALVRLRAVLVPLNSRLTPPELARQIGHIKPALLIHDEAHAAVAREAAHAILTLAWAKIALSPAVALTLPPQSLDDLHAIVFTSGTSGTPKGVELTYANHFWSATASAYRLGVLPDDRWLSCLPLYHVGGLSVLFRSCLYGTAAILHARFDVAAFHKAIDRDRVSLTSVVPTMLHRLLETRSTPWPATLRVVILGGAAAPPALLEAAAAQNLPVATTYGMTEAASQIATLPPQEAAVKPGSVGKPLLFTSVRILDEDGAPVTPGTVGAIAVRGPTITRGYFENPEADARMLTPPSGDDLYSELLTGDVGYLDDAGDLFVLQRRSDIIITGGENVYPSEVEAVLENHPGVARACVVGLDDAEWGQMVAALIERQPDADLTESALLEYLHVQLAGYKQPRFMHLTTALPQTASGKIERVAVRNILTAQRSQERG